MSKRKSTEEVKPEETIEAAPESQAEQPQPTIEATPEVEPVAEPQPEPGPTEEVKPEDKLHIVPLINLQRGKVFAVDPQGNKFRIAPSFRNGEYALFYVPEVK